MALDVAIEIMEIKLDPEHKSFDKLLARKTSITSAVMSTTARIDQTVLRGIKASKIDELMKAIQAEDSTKH